MCQSLSSSDLPLSTLSQTQKPQVKQHQQALTTSQHNQHYEDLSQVKEADEIYPLEIDWFSPLILIVELYEAN